VPLRPEIIDRLFEARYEREKATFADKAQADQRFRAVLREAAALFECSPEELQASWMNQYYLEWQVQNKLRTPPRQF
jgi:hypothetical protein